MSHAARLATANSIIAASLFAMILTGGISEGTNTLVATGALVIIGIKAVILWGGAIHEERGKARSYGAIPRGFSGVGIDPPPPRPVDTCHYCGVRLIPGATEQTCRACGAPVQRAPGPRPGIRLPTEPTPSTILPRGPAGTRYPVAPSWVKPLRQEGCENCDTLRGDGRVIARVCSGDCAPSPYDQAREELGVSIERMHVSLGTAIIRDLTAAINSVVPDDPSPYDDMSGPYALRRRVSRMPPPGPSSPIIRSSRTDPPDGRSRRNRR